MSEAVRFHILNALWRLIVQSGDEILKGISLGESHQREITLTVNGRKYFVEVREDGQD